VAKYFNRIFKSQIKGLDTTLEKLVKVENLMKILTDKMSKMVARMNSSAVKVIDTISQDKKLIKKEVDKLQTELDLKIDQIKWTLSSYLVEQLTVRKITDPYLDDEIEKLCG